MKNIHRAKYDAFGCTYRGVSILNIRGESKTGMPYRIRDSYFNNLRQAKARIDFVCESLKAEVINTTIFAEFRG